MLDVVVLGTHSKECVDLEINLLKALEQLGEDAAFKKISDFKEIAAYGVMQLPALVVNGAVKFEGKVPSVHELKTHYLVR